MAGFWGTMRRLMVGEPAFQPGDQKKPEETNVWGDGGPVMDPENESIDDVKQDEALEQPPVAADRYRDASGQKILPEVSVMRCETHVSGDMIELWLLLRNESVFDIMLSKITLLGSSTELSYFLKPSESREFRVYRGAKLKNGSYTRAEVYYKTVETGDYFRADFEIEYRVESDGDYVIDELRPIRPVHDI